MYAANETEMKLADKMDELLEEARNLGYCFSFETERWPNKCGHSETITIYSDEDEFVFDIIKLKGE